MAKRTLYSISFALALLGGAGLALAQDKAQEIKKQDSVPPMTDGTKSDQGGKQEPSSKISNTDGNAAVFANGTLNVAGADKDVDTAPAKFSSRNAADDKLPIAGYRLKHLSGEQKTIIYRELNSQQPSAASKGQDIDQHAIVGAEVPAGIALSALRPIPESLAARVPEMKGMAFAMSGGKVVLVDATMRTVVGVVAQ